MSPLGSTFKKVSGGKGIQASQTPQAEKTATFGGMKNALIFLILLTFQPIFGQQICHDARSAAMGNASATTSQLSSLFGNQAGLTDLKNFGAMAAAEQRFLLSELNTLAAGFALPTSSGTFGLTFQTFGFDEFRQQKLGLAYARRLWKALSLGAQFDYFQTKIPEYGSHGALTFELGIQAKISDELLLGVHFFNPAQAELVENERLASVFNFGLRYFPSEKANLVLELEKHLDFPVRLKGGVEYQAAKPLWLRAGFGTNPATFHFGVGLALKSNLKMDAASSFHQVLGLTPSFSAQWEKMDDGKR